MLAPTGLWTLANVTTAGIGGILTVAQRLPPILMVNRKCNRLVVSHVDGTGHEASISRAALMHAILVDRIGATVGRIRGRTGKPGRD